MIYQQKNPNFEPKFLEKHAKIKKFEIFFGKSRKNLQVESWKKIGRSSRSTPSDFLV